MGLIVKGEHKIISKKEMANKVAQDIENNAKDGMEKMTDSQKEIRKEIASAKRHREFMQRVATKKAVSVREEREIAEKEVIETPEIIVEARAEKEESAITLLLAHNQGIQLLQTESLHCMAFMHYLSSSIHTRLWRRIRGL